MELVNNQSFVTSGEEKGYGKLVEYIFREINNSSHICMDLNNDIILVYDSVNNRVFKFTIDDREIMVHLVGDGYNRDRTSQFKFIDKYDRYECERLFDTRLSKIPVDKRFTLGAGRWAKFITVYLKGII